MAKRLKSEQEDTPGTEDNEMPQGPLMWQSTKVFTFMKNVLLYLYLQNLTSMASSLNARFKARRKLIGAASRTQNKAKEAAERALERAQEGVLRAQQRIEDTTDAIARAKSKSKAKPKAKSKAGCSESSSYSGAKAEDFSIGCKMCQKEDVLIYPVTGICVACTELVKGVKP